MKPKTKRPSYAQEKLLDYLAYEGKCLRAQDVDTEYPDVWVDDQAWHVRRATFRVLLRNGWIKKLRPDIDHRFDRSWDIYTITAEGRAVII